MGTGAIMNKSWNASLENLRKSIANQKASTLSKAEGAPPAAMDDDDEALKAKKKKDDAKKSTDAEFLNRDTEGGQSMATAPDGGTGSGGGCTDLGSEGMADPGVPVRKSLMDRMAEMGQTDYNAEPFLKSLTEGLDQTNAEMTHVLMGEINGLKKSIGALTEVVNAQADFTLQNAELTKSIQGSVAEIGQIPVPPQGALTEGQVQARFQKSQPEVEPLTKAQVYDKVPELLKSGKLDLNDAAKIESRMEGGRPLGGEYEALFRN